MADVHVAISEVIAENLRALGVPDGRIASVSDGIDLTTFHAGPPRPGLREELGVSDSAPMFGLFGRIVPWKGAAEYVEAAALVLKELPDARALVVGDRSDGEEGYADAVRERTHQLGIGDRVLFTGFRPDVADLMRACDVVVHASLGREPFGLVVAEALSTGTPVVASDRGGPTEIVDQGETGFLVDPRDARAMADTILRLLRDPGEAREMGRVGHGRMAERYSARKCADGILAVYRRVLEASSVSE
jgi:glycosyltransferase involved in cell wall biosynthesis